MPRIMAGLLAMALMSLVEVAGASIIYTVNITDGTETVTGTITTDGFVGAILATDVIAWTLSASGLVAGGPVSETGPGAGVSCGSDGCGVTAFAGSLIFTGGGDHQAMSFGFGSPLNVNFLPLFIYLLTPTDHCCYIFAELQHPYGIGTVGTATAPEPGTATLLGIALACLGFACKRALGRQSAAV